MMYSFNMWSRRFSRAIEIFAVIQCLLLFTHVHAVFYGKQSRNDVPNFCNSPVYCQGDLLHRVQMADIESDSKTFVDFPMKFDESVVLENYNTLLRQTNNNPSRANLRRFVNNNFETTINELENATLKDWGNNFKLKSKVGCLDCKQWIDDINLIWKDLARQISNKSRENPKRHSLIFVDNPFIIAGGRFREIYYWDSFWIIEGLLLSGMNETARGMIENFISIINQYGFIPNGGRIYYLMRSQPPLLTWMVEKYYEFTKDWEFVRNSLNALHVEFQYWWKYKSIQLEKGGMKFTMFRYVTSSSSPRPESYKEDYELAESGVEKERRDYFYKNIKAAAETGWDFSMRWCAEKDGRLSYNLTDVVTEDIIPVDLNSIMQKNAQLLAKWFEKSKDVNSENDYKFFASHLKEAIKAINWNESEGSWFDYDLTNEKHRIAFYPSNFVPLYTSSYDEAEAQFYGEESVKYLKRSGALAFPGGIPTSSKNSRQQWDYPNGWAPLQSLIVQGFRKTGHPRAMEIARQMAEKWLTSNYISYQKTKKMFEKYLVTRVGESGSGGEYEVQEGFGWSNGVALEFLDTYPDFKCFKKPDAVTEAPPETSNIPKADEAPQHVAYVESIWDIYFVKRAIKVFIRKLLKYT